jgi:uncharacterized protein YbjQ (UPF0145 family)
MPIMTGLSGNEIFCLGLKNLAPGEMVIGNSVHSLGFLGGLGAGLRGIMGGEVAQVTEIIREGRLQSHGRIMQEAKEFGAHGVTGVTSELRHVQGNVEFLSVGSCVHSPETPAPARAFSSSSDGQELFCLLDAGYAPKQFVIGNVAYSVGVAGGVFGALKSLARGEIKEFSDVFNATRHLTLRRISAEARAAGANAVIGIETRIMPFRGVHEMLMLGTAAYHPALSSAPALGDAPQGAAVPGHAREDIVTSDLTCEEMWNLASLGYMPLKLVLGTAVYSLGLVGGVMAMFKGMARGEISELTSLIYEAREHAIGLIRDEAAAIGADDVVGITTHIHELGGLIEFMAIGTAVKRRPGATPATASLPVQAIIRDRDTWISGDDLFAAAVKSGGGGGGD